jgi:CRP/FNR family transcriptional regulator, cyclic AMP receptor protein
MIKATALTEIHRNLPFFRGLRYEHLETLQTLAHEVRFDRDQIIFREGDESSFFYIILSGRVSLEVTALGRTLRVQTVGEGEEFGWSSMLPSQGKQFQARALDALKALAFDGARLREACDEDPVFGYALMKRLVGVVSERLGALRVQLLDLYAPGVK